MQVAKNKYAVLDSAIMKILGKEPVPFSLIMLPDVAGECSRLADEERNKPMPFRILDRRLQALRKAGKIQFVTGKGWVKPSFLTTRNSYCIFLFVKGNSSLPFIPQSYSSPAPPTIKSKYHKQYVPHLSH